MSILKLVVIADILHLFYKDELTKLITEMFILRIGHDCYRYTLWA